MYFIAKSKQRQKRNVIKMNCILLLINTKNFVKTANTYYKVGCLLLFQNIFCLEKSQIIQEKYDKQTKLTYFIERKLFTEKNI